MRKVVASSLILLVSVTRGWASCGSATCPLDTRSSLQNEKGFIRLAYEFELIDQDQPRISTHKANVGEISGHHDEQKTVNRIHRFSGVWGVTDRLSVESALPVISRSHRHIHNHHGTPIPEGWDFTGLGDLALQGRYAFFKPADLKHPTLSGIFGVEFPTGKSEIHNADGDEAEPGITPGSDSYDFLVGGTSLQNLSVPTLQGEYAVMPFFVSLAYKINGKGHDDYKLGNVFSANTGVTYPLNRWLGFITQLNLLVKERDDQGLTGEEVEKTGGEYLYVSPGILIRLGERWELTAIAQVPLRQRVNNIQLTSDYNLLTGLSYKFRI